MSCDFVIVSDKIPRLALDGQLRRYHRSYRRRLRKMAHSSRRLKDLVYSFPGAAFAIAGGISNSTQRAQAANLVREGAGLRQIGKLIGLPGWARRLPPEAFYQSLGALPDGFDFAKHIINTIPKNPEDVSDWFQWVMWGYQYCDENFALWIARQRFWRDMIGEADIILPLAAYAWYSQTEDTLAGNLIDNRWTSNVGFAKAHQAATRWQMRCLYEYCAENGQNAGRWFAHQSVSGIKIVPLRTPNELSDEGNKMGHCVEDYTSFVLSGKCLIYSVRRGNQRMATLEVRPRSARDDKPIISQLLGPRNAAVDEYIHRAVDVWLSHQGKYPYAGNRHTSLHPLNPLRWQNLWAPYLESMDLGRQVVHPGHIKLALDRLAAHA